MIGWTLKIIAFIATVAFAFVVKANVVLLFGASFLFLQSLMLSCLLEVKLLRVHK